MLPARLTQGVALPRCVGAPVLPARLTQGVALGGVGAPVLPARLTQGRQVGRRAAPSCGLPASVTMVGQAWTVF